MEIVIALLCTGSVIASVALGTEGELSKAAAEAAGESFSLWLTVAAAMAFWSGLMKAAERCGMTGKLCALVRPLLARLMPDAARDREAMDSAALNVTSNLLGLGNAATPFGLKAMRAFERSGCSRRSIAVLVLLNTASVQLLPMTLTAIRAEAGSASPFDCVVPVLANSAAALTCGLVTVFALYGGRKCALVSQPWRRRC